LEEESYCEKKAAVTINTALYIMLYVVTVCGMILVFCENDPTTRPWSLISWRYDPQKRSSHALRGTNTMNWHQSCLDCGIQSVINLYGTRVFTKTACTISWLSSTLNHRIPSRLPNNVSFKEKMLLLWSMHIQECWFR
jgi:hypothetical protein